MVDEMEKAGHRPDLANPTEAKKRMGKTNKTDALAAKGLAILLHNGTLPESWIRPATRATVANCFARSWPCAIKHKSVTNCCKPLLRKMCL